MRFRHAVVIEKTQMIRCVFAQANAAESRILDDGDGDAVSIENRKFCGQGVCGSTHKRGTGQAGLCLAGAEGDSPHLDGDKGNAIGNA